MNILYLRRCMCLIALSLICLSVICGCLRSPQNAGSSSSPTAKLRFDEGEIPGRYYFGDGLGINCALVLQANHRFTFKWTGCLGVYDRNQGTWDLNGDVLTVHPEKPNVREGFRGMDTRFIPVKWGSRYLLVDENEMPGFCATASKELPPRGEYGRGTDYVKVQNSGGVPQKSVPVIPERYRDYYEKVPVEVKIVRLLDGGHAVLDGGLGDRVRRGMLLARKDHGLADIEVLSVDDHGSEARPIYFMNSRDPIRIGDQFTTGSTWDRPHGTGMQHFSNVQDAERHRRGMARRQVLMVLVSPGIMFPILWSSMLIVALRSFLQIRRFLRNTPRIDDEKSLEDFKVIARSSMRGAIRIIVLGIPTVIYGFLWSRHLGLYASVMKLFLFAVLLVVGLLLGRLERKARSLPCSSEQLEAEHRRISKTWVKKPFPDF